MFALRRRQTSGLHGGPTQRRSGQDTSAQRTDPAGPDGPRFGSPLSFHDISKWFRPKKWYGRRDSNPHGLRPRDFKSLVSTIPPRPRLPVSDGPQGVAFPFPGHNPDLWPDLWPDLRRGLPRGSFRYPPPPAPAARRGRRGCVRAARD